MERERLNGQRLVYLNEIAKISLVDGSIYCQVESEVDIVNTLVNMLYLSSKWRDFYVYNKVVAFYVLS